MIRTLAFILALLCVSPALADRCGLVDTSDGSLLGLRTFEGDCPPDLPAKDWEWVPAPVVSAPTFDRATEVLEGPTYSVGDAEITESWAVRDKTAQELDADKDAVMSAINVATFRALCHLKNEVRTKVDRLTAWSEAQCLEAFKGLLP